MVTEPSALATDGSAASRAILLAGVTAGCLDITAAFIVSGLRGQGPVLVLQRIASSLLRANAFKLGLGAAALGLAIHFCIAFSAAGAYYIGSRRLDVMLQRPVPSGLLYGVLVYFSMNFLVLPLGFSPIKIPHP